jgi:hypothetical protein
MPERRKRERCRRAALGPPAAVRGHPASIMSTSGGGGTDPRAADRSSWGSGARPRQRRRAEKGAAWWSRYERGNADLARTGRPTWLVSAVRRVDRTVAACRHASGRGGSVTVQASASSGRARGTRSRVRSRVRSSYGARSLQRDPGARARLAVMRWERSAPRHPPPICAANIGRARPGPMSGSSGRERGSATVLVARNATTRPPDLTASSRARRLRPEVRRGGGESDGRTPRGRAGRDPA